MQTALNEVPQDTLQIPEFIEEGFVNRRTGKRTEELDPEAIPEYFVIEALLPELERPITTEVKFPLLMDDQVLEQTGIEDIYPAEPTLPEDRIIESEEDTEGLF